MVFENYACPACLFNEKEVVLIANVTDRGCGLGFGESDMFFILQTLNSVKFCGLFFSGKLKSGLGNGHCCYTQYYVQNCHHLLGCSIVTMTSS